MQTANTPADGEGIELPAQSSGKTASGEKSGAESGALSAPTAEKWAADRSSPATPERSSGGVDPDSVGRRVSDAAAIIDADLRIVINAWATLPAAVRAGVVALVKASSV